ncbi:hypothetical protein Tco_1010393 [Tanacetum coccineum]
MFEVSIIREDDLAELFVASMFGEVLGEGACLSIELDEDALAVSSGCRVAAEMGVDTALGDLKYSSNIDLVRLIGWRIADEDSNV